MRRVTLAACATAAAALVLAGCGSKPAADQGGSDFGSLKVMANSVGEKSASKQSAHVVMDVSALGQSVKADGDLRLGNDLAIDMNLDVAGMGTTKLVVVGDTFYMKLPTETQPGKPWVKIDASGDDPLSKALGGVIKQAKESGDPSKVLAQVQDAGEITGKKQESLNGKNTTHYTVVVDAKKAAEKLQPELRAAMDQAIKAGVDKYPFDIWLDEEDLPVRIAITTPFVNPQTQKSDEVKATVDYTDWGKTVSVTAPPADQIGELPKR
jgi:hypothetical protein